VEEHVLARSGGGAGGLEMGGVGRRVDDRLDALVPEHLFVRVGSLAAVFLRERVPFLGGAAVAGGDRHRVRPLDGVRQHVGPTPHPRAGDPNRHAALAPIASTASRASFWSCSQLPPATPMPPTHSPSTRTGQPPSIAVQRSGPAARARPMACATSSDWPTAPW